MTLLQKVVGRVAQAFAERRAALHEQPGTANIPIVIVTSKTITAEDRGKLNGLVSTILEKGDFSGGQFASEVRRALSRRHSAV